MARLVRNTGTEIEVCKGRLFNHAYGYIYVDQCDENTVLPDGWTYSAEDVEVEDFIPIWKQPEGAHDAYDLGAVVTHANKNYRSTIKANVWEPGVYGWVEVLGDGELPAWAQPLGAHDAYSVGAVVTHSGSRWESTVEANVWEPGVFGWKKTLLEPPPVYDPNVLPDWVQPTGAHDAYNLGDRVRHNGLNWESNVSNNVWTPGIFGWTQL